MMKFDRLPKQIQKTMLKRQYEQLGLKNTAAFEDDVCTRTEGGGFDWEDTPEGQGVWERTLLHGDLEAFYSVHPNKRPKITRDQFMEFYRDEELEKTLTVDDRIEIFSQILLGSSDFTPQLLSGILNDYGVDDVFVDGGETLKELEEAKKELAEIKSIKDRSWHKPYLRAAKELKAIKEEGGFEAAINEKLDEYLKLLEKAKEEREEARGELQLVKDNWNDTVNKWRKERTNLEETANALKTELKRVGNELIEWRSVASTRADQVNSLCDEIGELKNKIAKIREESAKYYMSMAGTSYYCQMDGKLTTVSIVLNHAKIETDTVIEERNWGQYHRSTKEKFLKAKADALDIINNQIV